MRPDNPPIPACDAERELFDATMERPHRELERAAKRVCAACPLLDVCRDTYTRDEYKDVIGVVAGLTHAERFPERRPTTRPTCGTEAGTSAHYRADEKPCRPCLDAAAAGIAKRRAERARADANRRHQRNHATRLAELQALADAGSGVRAALRQLDISRDNLRRWCHRHGHLDLWARLVDGDEASAGRITTPKRLEGAA